MCFLSIVRMRQTPNQNSTFLTKNMAAPDPQHLALPIYRPWPVGRISSCCTIYIGSALSNLSTTCGNSMPLPLRALRSGPLIACRKKTRNINAFSWASSLILATVNGQSSSPTKLGRYIGNVPTGLGRYIAKWCAHWAGEAYNGKSMFHLSLG